MIKFVVVGSFQEISQVQQRIFIIFYFVLRGRRHIQLTSTVDDVLVSEICRCFVTLEGVHLIIRVRTI